MKDELVDFLRKVKTNPSLNSLGETATKSGIIEAVLRLLGWDTSIASSEVVLEFAIDQGRVDYCLETNKTNRVFLEAEKPMEDLDSHQDQLLGYGHLLLYFDAHPPSADGTTMPNPAL